MSYYISSERMRVIWLIKGNRKVRSEDILVTMPLKPFEYRVLSSKH